MPLGDRTGPLGMGPKTGRGAGYCSGFGMPGYANPVPVRGWFGFGRGWSRGRGLFGRGCGWRHWYWATGLPGWARAGYGYQPFWGYPYASTAREEIDVLREEAEFLKKELEEVQSRIKTLEKAQSQEGE